MSEARTEAAEGMVLLTRTFDAPREVVFAAWTDRDEVAQWWGPPGFHVPRETVEIDLRVGGRYHLCMVQTDSGAEFPCRFEIAELVVPELLVLTSAAQPEFGLVYDTVSRIEFHDAGAGTTRVTISDGPYAPQMSPNAEAGWDGQLGRLAELLGGSA